MVGVSSAGFGALSVWIGHNARKLHRNALD